MQKLGRKLLSFVLALTMAVLICPIPTFAEETIKPDKDLTYGEYFENIHGFYSDTVTKSKQYLNMRTGLFSSLVKKEANGRITRDGQEITGIIGNSEMVFFAMNNTVYRYHVKSKKIDRIFTESTMESFYPISSHVILWKKAESQSVAVSKLMNNSSAEKGQYYTYDIRDGFSTKDPDPAWRLSLTRGGGYTDLSRYSVEINGTGIPLSSYPIGSYYTGSHNGSIQCRGFSWMVYRECWGTYSHGITRLSNVTVRSEDTLYSYAALYGKGSRFNFSGEENHSMIITQVYNGEIYVYHANWSAPDKVSVTKFNKEQFFSYFQTFQSVQDPR